MFNRFNVVCPLVYTSFLFLENNQWWKFGGKFQFLPIQETTKITIPTFVWNPPNNPSAKITRYMVYMYSETAIMRASIIWLLWLIRGIFSPVISDSNKSTMSNLRPVIIQTFSSSQFDLGYPSFTVLYISECYMSSICYTNFFNLSLFSSVP